MTFLLCLLCGERPVFERQTVGPPATPDGVAGLNVVRKGHDLVAGGATDPLGECRGPTPGVLVKA